MTRLKLKKEVYELDESIMTVFIGGIVNGTERFKNDKSSAKEELAVYSGINWSRSNIVDTGIQNTLKAYGLDSVVIAEKDQVASYAYLKFSVKSSHSLIIVKHVDTNGLKDVEDHTAAGYIDKLKQINKDNFMPEKDVILPLDVQTELDLIYGDENNSLEKSLLDEYNRFYVLTYTVDTQNEVTSVKMWMADPFTNGVAEIKDYSYMLGEVMTALNSNDMQNIGEPKRTIVPYPSVESKDKDSKQGKGMGKS